MVLCVTGMHLENGVPIELLLDNLSGGEVRRTIDGHEGVREPERLRGGQKAWDSQITVGGWRCHNRSMEK